MSQLFSFFVPGILTATVKTVYFRPFLNTMTNIVQHLTTRDGVLGIRTRDRMMVGVEQSTELNPLMMFELWSTDILELRLYD